MPFGGTVKLTGESEYRAAIKNITNELRGMSKELRAQATEFSSNSKLMNAAKGNQEKLTASLKDQESNLNKAKSALAQYTVALQAQQTKHTALSKEYRSAVLELEKIRKESGETSDAYKKQEEVVDKLGQELADSTEEMNKSKAAMSELKSEINSSQKTIDATQQALDGLGNEAEEAGNKAKKGGDGFTVLKGVVADLASKAIQSALSGLKQLGTAVVDVGKQAYASYGEYEQLKGGVETLFGDSSERLLKYAQNAYKTAGLSANQYMEQATSFSATLLQGLEGDTRAAVKYADLAITDMADNANKMGTDMASIQNAYQGFAKDNYTMLDNLKLGYGGTQAEMARLINDSGVLGDAVKVTSKTVKDVPFDKIIEAIHKTQQEIGITGTTTLEAEKTIQGSTAAMKAAWENLLVGIADENQDIGPLVDNFVEQVIAMGKNSAPRIKEIVKGIGEVVDAMWNQVLPQLADSVPELAPFIEKLTWLKDNAKLVGAGITTIAAAIAASKIINFGKDIGSATSAIKNLITATKAAEKGQLLLNTAWLSSPITWVVAGIAALAVATAAVTKAYNAQIEAEYGLSDAQKASIERVDELTDSYNSMAEARDSAVADVTAEWDYIESLKEEYNGLIDANGKVKEGYEDRATFIKTTLAQSLGIELEEVERIIDANGKLGDSIDELIIKKKAQAMLENYEASYTEAIQQRNEAFNAYMDSRKHYDDVLANNKSAEEEYNKVMERYNEIRKTSFDDAETWLSINSKVIDGYNKSKEALNEAEKSMNDAEDAYVGYSTTVQNYENLTTATITGGGKEIEKALQNLQNNFITAEKGTKQTLVNQYNDFKKNYENLKRAAEEGGQGVTQEMVDQAKNAVDGARDELSKFIQTSQETMEAAGDAAVDGLGSKEGELVGAAQSLVIGMQNAFADGESGSKTAGETNGKAFADGVDSKKGEAESAGQSVGESALSGAKKGSNPLAGAGSAAGQSFSKGVIDQSGKANSSGKTLGSSAASGAVVGAKGIKSSGQNAGNDYAAGIGSTAGTVDQQGRTIGGKAKSGVESVKARQSGVDFGTGFGNGISSTSNSIWNTAWNLAKNALNAVKKAINSNSPSKEAAKLGGFFSDGFAVGISDESKEAVKASTEMAKDSLKALGGFSKEMAQIGADSGEEFSTALSDNLRVTAAVQNMRLPDNNVGNITANHASVGGASSERYNDIVKAFKSALADMKIELDDDEVGRFVDKTVTKLVYN